MKKSDKRVNGKGSTKYPSQLKSSFRGKDKKLKCFGGNVYQQMLPTYILLHNHKDLLSILSSLHTNVYRIHLPKNKMDLHDWGKW